MRKRKKTEPNSGSLTNAEWNAERQAMETLDSSLVGRRILVADVELDERGQLGYTSKGSVIHVAREHEYYEKFTKNEAMVFRFGVNVHEALHQMYTDFDAFYATTEGILSRTEQEMFAQIFNLVEDPAIENFAEQAVGGFALDALYFMIEKIYEDALPVSGPQNHGDALEEYIDALIQFGDRGIVKGGFSSDVAREYFNRTAPIIYQAVNEPDGSERVRLAMKVYQAARPLWAGRSDAKARQAVAEVSGRYAKAGVSGAGKGKIPQKAADARNGRREKEIEKKKKEEEETLKKDAGQMPGAENWDGGQDGGQKDTGKEPSQPGNSYGTDASGSGDSDGSEEPEGKTDGHGDARDTADAKETEDTGNGSREASGEPEGENGRQDTDDGPVFQYDPNVADQLAEALKGYLMQETDEETPDDSVKTPESYTKAISSENKKFSGITEKNIIPPHRDMESQYSDILHMAAWITDPLIIQLKKIFVDDRGGKAYTQRGKISMKRAASGRVTTRMFERRILPGDKADMCLMLLIDLSGSMTGKKMQSAKLAAIVLCEVFAYFKIPVYCMGFQSTNGVDAYQTHFVRWRNTMEERMSILSAVPGGSNFDSYSIRYASEALRKRTEKHKLLCVISDGIPSHYFSDKEGIQENTKAIQDTRLSGADVFGMAVGMDDADKFREMYGKDYFIGVNRPEDLAGQTASLIKTVVKNW